MKKILLASTVALSMAGFAKTTVYAEDSQATNNIQSSERTSSNTVSNEKKNQSEAEKATSKTPDTQEQSSKEAIVEVVNKEGWQKENNQWRYYENNQSVSNWKKIAGVWYYFNQDGIMLSNIIFNDYLLNSSGAMAESSWVKIADKWYFGNEDGKIIRDKWEKINGTWYYFNKDGNMLSSQWKSKYYLKDSGAMAKNEWVFDKNYDAWYYLKEDGGYVTGTFKIKGKDYSFQSNGKWISDPSSYYKVTPITANVYSASGEKLSYISQGSIVSVTGAEVQGGRLPVKISGLSGYMNKSDLVAVSSDSDFIPHYTTDGRYLYHELSPYASIRIAPHSSSMTIGKKYYSADGINFKNFTVENPFLFRDLRKPSNYTAEELDKVYSLMNIKGSRLAGKGAIFKEAEERYQINALYLIAHSALESSWGRSQIAKDKNNFFGIAAYDTTPYDSAKSFDDVDKGILAAAKWIRENYIDNGRTYLGNKASGMNVLYASDPYWGEKIASIMMRINSQLGEKD